MNEKLKQLLMEVFLLDEGQIHLELKREEISTWDSLGVVSLAVGIEEVFGYHMKPDEALGLKGIPDLLKLLQDREVKIN
jgi:acyl carrier protein